MKDEHIPVIAGCGEIMDRPASLLAAREPLSLMAEAACRAGDDASPSLLQRVDSIDVVNLASWRYADIAGALAARLSLSPDRTAYGEVGGESPVRLLHEAALRIARGESRVALLCGAEAQHSAAKARREGVILPWTPYAKDGPRIPRGEDIVHPLAVAAGVSQPVHVYPLYEAAASAHWGQSPGEALAETGELWSRYSAVAAENPVSWQRKAYGAGEITDPSPENRLVAWPYTKRMIANPMVNQGAAILVSSLGAAREAGIPDERLIFFAGGAAASEPRDFMQRDQFWRSHAQEVVLESAMALAPAGFAATELYSCFPCVPKMARRTLGLDPGAVPTVTGGLSFFGAPLSNYMLHAACAMAGRLRSRTGQGLLYGQGEFVTKHHALVLSATRPAGNLSEAYSVEELADQRRGPVPPVRPSQAGPAMIESFTILFDRDGGVRHGVVVVRAAEGARTIARVPGADGHSIARLRDTVRSPVGLEGLLVANREGEIIWRTR